MRKMFLVLHSADMEIITIADNILIKLPEKEIFILKVYKFITKISTFSSLLLILRYSTPSDLKDEKVIFLEILNSAT